MKRDLERRAAMMGGGNFVVPVQTVTDFMDKKLSGTLLCHFYVFSPRSLFINC